MIVALEVRWFPMEKRAVYSIAYTLPGTSKVTGGTWLLDAGDCYDEPSAWASAALETGCRAVLATEAFPEEPILLQADRPTLAASMVSLDWKEPLKSNLAVFVQKVLATGRVRIRNRAGGLLSYAERMALNRVYEEVLQEGLAHERGQSGSSDAAAQHAPV